MAKRLQKQLRAKPRQKSKAKARPLSAREAAFVREYLVDANGAGAARRAGYSHRTAAQIASKLLSKVQVLQAIAKGQHERSERTKIDADWVLKRLVAEATADLADIYDEQGALLPIHEWPEIWRQGLVAGIEVETTVIKGSTGSGQWHGQSQDVHEEEGHAEVVVRKVKLSERVKRLELIGRHVDIQAWKDRKELSADAPLRALAEQISGRAIRPQESGGAS